MPFDYFAGVIFTTQEVVIFYVAAFVGISLFAGLVIFTGKKLLGTTRKTGTKRTLGLGKALLVGFGLVANIILLFFVTPTVIKDSKWDRKQQSCAQQAGYEDSADDNSNRATAESQTLYGNCING